MSRLFAHLTAFLLFVGATTVARAVELDVYVLTGQSNSLGTTFDEGTTAELYGPGTDPADATTRFFWSNVSGSGYPPALYGDSAGAVTALQMQQGLGVDPAFWGPEFGFARTMSAVGATDVMVIKVSRGGGGNTLWDKAAFEANQNSGHMWGHLRDTVDAALSAAQVAGYQIQVRGLLYLQGESNGSAEASNADRRLSNLVANLQQHIDSNFSSAASDMKTVIGEIAASSSNASRVTTTNLQRSLADHRADIAFIQTHDLPLKSDALHFGRDAKLAIGQRFADAILDLQSRPKSMIARYSADVAVPTSVPHPTTQGWTEIGASASTTLEGMTDSGTRGWQILDNAASGNPGYYQPLATTDYQAMFENGWTFRAEVKVVSGGGMALWSVTQANAPTGWHVANGPGNMVGFEVERVGDQFQVKLWQGQSSTTVNLGTGSANQFHTLELVGHAGANTFDFLVDGQLRFASRIDVAAGLPGSENRALIQSGSVGGVGRSVIWSEVSLQAVPEPPCVSGLVSGMLLLSSCPRNKGND